MTGPESTKSIVEADVTVVEDPAVTESVTADESTTAEEPILVDDPVTAVDESAPDAELRAWAKDNGIEDVPASGRLSAAWREEILAAMTAALDSEEEPPVEAPPAESPPLVSTEDPVEEESQTERPVQPEFETGEYRSVFKAPNTFVTSQNYTA